MHRELFKDISADFEEAAIIQASKLPAKFWIANKNKHHKKRWKGSKGVWKHHYIAHATEDYINAIIIDVDSNVTVDAILSVLPANLRPASIVGLTKKKNYQKCFVRPHIRFNLLYPVKKDSDKQIAWLKNITAELQRLISQVAIVDPNTPTYITKNPLSGRWDYETFGEFAFKEYDLAELSELLQLKKKKVEQIYYNKKQNVINFKTREVVKTKTEVGYRNDDLFNVVRYKAYALKFKVSSESELHDLVLELCVNHNSSFNSPLPKSEVKATAKSISGWTWKNVTHGSKAYNVGAAAKYINDEDDIKRRMQVGAYYSNKVRSNKSLHAISQAILDARQEGLDITKKGIAQKTGISLKTVKKWWEQAQNSDVYYITEADKKLHNIECQGGGSTPPSEKVYLSDVETETNEETAEENNEQQYSVDIKPKESNLITIRATEIYTSDSYRHVQVINNDTYDDSCPF